MTALLVIAVALDSVTFLAIGTHREANPIVLALGPGLALGIRWTAVAALVAAARYLRTTTRRLLLAAGALAGTVGFVSNVRALA